MQHAALHRTHLDLAHVLAEILPELHVDVARQDLVLANLLSALVANQLPGLERRSTGLEDLFAGGEGILHFLLKVGEGRHGLFLSLSRGGLFGDASLYNSHG